MNSEYMQQVYGIYDGESSSLSTLEEELLNLLPYNEAAELLEIIDQYCINDDDLLRNGFTSYEIVEYDRNEPISSKYDIVYDTRDQQIGINLFI